MLTVCLAGLLLTAATGSAAPIFETTGYITGVAGLSFDYANIFGVGAGEFDTGLYGVQVEAIPLPPSVVMLLSGLFLLVVVRRRAALPT